MTMKTVGAVPGVNEEITGGDFETQYMRVNVGPQHPSTHGVLRLVVDLGRRTHRPNHPANRLPAHGF